MDSVASGRFPRALPQLPRCFAPAGPSTNAKPAEVAAFGNMHFVAKRASEIVSSEASVIRRIVSILSLPKTA